jgi:hypothetical protein
MSAESRKQKAGSRRKMALQKPPCGSYLRSAFCFLSRKFIPSKVYKSDYFISRRLVLKLGAGFACIKIQNKKNCNPDTKTLFVGYAARKIHCYFVSGIPNSDWNRNEERDVFTLSSIFSGVLKELKV